MQETSVFEYLNYRVFLQDHYDRKRADKPSYSMSAFIRKAGLRENSRGYLKLVIEGKRNLTQHTIRRFAEALELSDQASNYFESLVGFNQSKHLHDREHFFNRLTQISKDKKSKQLKIMESQFRFFSNWYYVAIHQLVELSEFREDYDWISSILKKKITRTQAKKAVEDLLDIGFLIRDDEGFLETSDPLLKFEGGKFYDIIEKYHLQMMDRAKESMSEDLYPLRNFSGVTLACEQSRFEDLKKMVDQFRDQLMMQFSTELKNPDAIFQVNFQVFQLTSPPTKKTSPQKGEAK